MRKALISKIFLLAVLAACVPAASAVTFTGSQTAPGEWTYTLTFESIDNYSIFQPQTRIILSGLSGVTSATAPTSTEFPDGLNAINLAWTPVVLNGGTVVQWTHQGSGTGNIGGNTRVFGFKVFAAGATSGPVAVVTDGVSRDTGNLLNGKHELDIHSTTVGPRAANLARILPVGGSGQAALAGAAFTDLLKARVLDGSDNPVVGATVTFTAPGAGASLTPVTTQSVTDANGVATAPALTANATAGSYLVMATTGNLSAAFGLTNVSGQANLVLRLTGTPQRTAVNTDFPLLLKAIVVDNNGSPVSGVTVTFTAPATGASATFLGNVQTAVSDAAGIATSVVVKANGTVGQYSVTAAKDNSSASFFLTNEPFATVSGASFLLEPLAPESIASSFGTGLAASTEQNSGVPLPTTLGGISVKVVDGSQVERSAGLYLASPGQVNFVVPAGTPNGTVTVKIGGAATQSALLDITRVAPGIFPLNSSDLAAAQIVRVLGASQAVEEVYNVSNGQIVPKPIVFGAAPEDLYLVLFGTGIRGRNSLSNVTVSLGGSNLTALYAGAQPQFPGLDQVNIGPLPRSLQGKGSVDVVVSVEGKAAKTVKLSFQ